MSQTELSNREQAVEQAIVFLVESVTTTGHNPKPVILHSIRTALYLDRQDCPLPVVIAAVLHDVVEDTAVTVDDIERTFSTEVASLVAANTFNPSIGDKLSREVEMFRRCQALGKDALLIKAADILDNAPGFRPDGGEELFRYFLEKMRRFLEMSQVELSGERVWSDLKAQYDQMIRL